MLPSLAAVVFLLPLNSTTQAQASSAPLIPSTCLHFIINKQPVIFSHYFAMFLTLHICGHAWPWGRFLRPQTGFTGFTFNGLLRILFLLFKFKSIFSFFIIFIVVKVVSDSVMEQRIP